LLHPGLIGTVGNMDSTLVSQPIVLTAHDIAALPLKPLGPNEGVMHRVVWRDGRARAGVLTVDAGHRLGTHAHRLHHHHIWVIEGRATILGTVLGPRSYVHVPKGVEHDIDASATDGCTVFYLYAELAA